MDSLKRKSNVEVDEKSNKMSKRRSASISSSLTCQASKDFLKMVMKSACMPNVKPDSCNVDMYMEPFQLCLARQFISDTTFVDELRDELLQLQLIYKCNDLYQYHQSADLSTISTPTIDSFKELLMGQCRDFVAEVTGKELSHKLTLNCSAYNYTDHLLCHDDNTEDRLIAFVFYLTSKTWTESDGGQLQMFDVDENNQPRKVAQSLLPEYNSFVFFEVTDKSFHQVAEVLTADRTRLSINGWFHGTPNSPNPPYNEPLPTCYRATPLNTSIDTYVNSSYLSAQNASRLAEHFEEMSELFLSEFIKEDPYMKIALALQSNDIRWIHRGPADRRNYLVADIDSLPSSVKDIVDFFKSSEMFKYLEEITQLELSSHEASVSIPTCTVEVQRWEPGHYTLVHDHDNTLSQQVLDVCLYFNAEAVESFHGGFTSYIARDDDEELMTVSPIAKGLAMTFRDKDTLRFVKYINHRLSQEDLFHTICLTYSE